ncbi:MAG: AAA family ATPase [Chitinivibrionales bacterium]|nr:AAA family ATPase [Chitinivibrionales bacterium]
MKVISVMNYKGGVGKTTFTACTAQALALTGFRVLAIDNDGQHDLSTMLGVSLEKPTIRDIYRESIGPASQRLMKAIRETELPYLHAITSENDLCNGDITDPFLLQKCFAYTMLHRFYDFVLIDNGPGMDALQISSVHAADEIFVPTELRQFAINGIRDMHDVLRRRYPQDCAITKIIPIFYRDTKAQRGHRDSLEREFPGKVTQTPIPYDSVFDELVSEGKNLFLHRLSSKGAAYYLKIIHELFGLDEEATWNMVLDKRQRRQSDEARRRFIERRLEDGSADEESGGDCAAKDDQARSGPGTTDQAACATGPQTSDASPGVTIAQPVERSDVAEANDGAGESAGGGDGGGEGDSGEGARNDTPRIASGGESAV